MTLMTLNWWVGGNQYQSWFFSSFIYQGGLVCPCYVDLSAGYLTLESTIWRWCFFLFSKGHFPRDSFTRLGKTRLVFFCERCIADATSSLDPQDPPDVVTKLLKILSLAESLPLVTEATNLQTIGQIMYIFSKGQAKVVHFFCS